MLAGWAWVCILNAAHRSTVELGSLPSEGSRQRTNISVHRIPISGRGVSSGAKQSTCTVDGSPWAFITSNDTLVLRTTRVRSKGPSIIRRLEQVRTCRFSSGRQGIPMRLDQRTGKFSSDSGLPFDKLAPGFRFEFPSVHVVSQ